MNPIPVLCDQCRAAGVAGEAPFADLADLLSFTPVPRRPHVNGWDEERQRAFIAGLLAEFTGGPDALAELRADVEDADPPPSSPLPPAGGEEQRSGEGEGLSE